MNIIRGRHDGEDVADVAEAVLREALPRGKPDPFVDGGRCDAGTAGNEHLDLRMGLAVFDQRVVMPEDPVRVGVGLQRRRGRERIRRRVEGEMGRQRDAGRGENVRLGDVADYAGGFFGLGRGGGRLRDGDVDDGGCPAKFGGADGAGGRTDCGAAEKTEVEGDGVGLMVRTEGGVEVDAGNTEDTCGDIAAMRNWGRKDGYDAAWGRFTTVSDFSPVPIDHSAGKTVE